MTRPDTEGARAAPPHWREYITDAALVEAAGAAVFQRGLALAQGDAVEVQQCRIDTAQPEIRAEVQGSMRYSVWLRLSGEEIASGCSCPHAAEGWFCKHQVAVAMHWRAALDGQALASDPEAVRRQSALAKRARTQAENAAALRDFVLSQPAEALAARLLQWAQDWPELRRDLKAWMQASRVRDDPTQMRRAVTEILSGRGFMDWRESAVYAARAEKVLTLLDEALQRDAGAALPGIEQAYLKLQAVLHQADDSDGAIGALVQEVGQRWRQAVASSGPHPAALGERYLALRKDEIFDGIGHAEAVRAMGAEAAARYGRLRCRAWEAAVAARAQRRADQPLRSGRRHARDNEDEGTHGPDSVWTTQLYYEEHLRAVEDGEELLRVLRSDLDAPYPVLKLVEELNRQGRHREALQEARTGLQRFPDDDRLQQAVLAAYDRDGWDEEALALRQRRFAQRPSAQAFAAVLATAPRVGVDAGPLRAQMWADLAAREQRLLAEAQKRPWGEAIAGTDVSLRLEILLQEDRLEAALELVQPPHRAQPDLLEQLARRLPLDRRAQATALFQRILAVKMTQAKSPYTEVLLLVKQVADRLDPAECSLWLARLKAEYRAKRKFIQGLPSK